MTNDDGFVSPMQFYKDTMDSEGEVRNGEIENDKGMKIKVELHGVDRKKLLDEIDKLPDAMLQTLANAEDEEEARESAEEQNLLSNINGATIEAFENICALALEDPEGELTYHNFQDIVKQLDFEVLFEMGAEVIEISFDNAGTIKHFRKQE